jgi:hypothetical protein
MNSINKRNYSEIKDFDTIKQWSYTLAKEWIIKNLVPKGVTSSRRFDAYKKEGGYLPKYFPRKIHAYFQLRGVWKGWDDIFEDLSPLEKKHFVDYETAKKITQNAGIKTATEYSNWKKRPLSVPSQPKNHYKEWSGWKDYLGKNYKYEKDFPTAKLKENEVRIIKHQLQLGVPAASLAKLFSISDMQVIRIKRGENWGHITM